MQHLGHAGKEPVKIMSCFPLWSIIAKMSLGAKLLRLVEAYCYTPNKNNVSSNDFGLIASLYGYFKMAATASLAPYGQNLNHRRRNWGHWEHVPPPRDFAINKVVPFHF